VARPWPANFDRTHAFTAGYVWELPFGRGRRWHGDSGAALNLLLGGWNFSGITTVESGLPFTPQVSSAPNVLADLNSFRADKIGNPSVANPSADLWFNPAAFITPQTPGRNGTASHNSLRGPGLYQFDLALGKTFTIVEGKTLEFKWENYNATNHVTWPILIILWTKQVRDRSPRQLTCGRCSFGLHFRF